MRALFSLGLGLSLLTILAACSGERAETSSNPLGLEFEGTTTDELGADLLTLDLDIKPRVCPNRIRQMRRGQLRAAIVGSAEFDVRDVDLRSLRLEGVRPRRASIRDLTGPDRCASSTVSYRVNCGGPAIADAGGAWMEDSADNRSPYVNTGFAAVTSATIDVSDPSIPANTPAELFQSERWDWSSDPEMRWDFPVTDGEYVVRLFFADHYPPNHEVGKRVFDVRIEDQLVLDDYDIFADVGGFSGVMKEFTVTVSDGSLTLDFDHVVENPNIAAIEILSTAAVGQRVRSVEDGIDDLVLSFSKRKLHRALGRLPRGEEIPLTLTGRLLDGTPFEAQDVVILRGRQR